MSHGEHVRDAHVRARSVRHCQKNPERSSSMKQNSMNASVPSIEDRVTEAVAGAGD